MENDLSLWNTVSLSVTSFPEDLVNEAIRLGSTSDPSKKADLKAFRAKAKELYASLDAEAKGKVQKGIDEAKKARIAALEEIEATRVHALEGENAAYAAIANPTQKDTRNHKDAVAGIEIVARRASKKAWNDYEEALKAAKLIRFDLHEEYVALLKEAMGRVPAMESLRSSSLESYANFSFRRTITNKKFWVNLIPAFMLILIILAYAITRNAVHYTGDLGTIINNAIFVAVVATGAVFIYSQGGFDMSLGNASLMCAAIAAIMWNNTHNIAISLVVSIVLGAVLGIINAILATMLGLPVMVMTLTMMNILSAVADAIFANYGGLIEVTEGFLFTNETSAGYKALIFAIFLLVYFLLCWFIFNWTKIGRRNKFIGSNKVAAKFNGISLMKAGIISFAISGIGLGLAGFLYASSRSGSQVQNGGILSTVGLNVVIAIVFGGMTTSGGPKSKVSCAIFGAFFCVFLDEFFAALNMVAPIEDFKFIAKGVIFLLVSLGNMWDTRTKMLASGGSIQ
ncbi:MAG: ABC transporter permease [Candidatus Enteromonas sp.]|nr:ABC transporter permease [Candidatus Enteromonas sp.]